MVAAIKVHVTQILQHLAITSTTLKEVRAIQITSVRYMSVQVDTVKQADFPYTIHANTMLIAYLIAALENVYQHLYAITILKDPLVHSIMIAEAKTV